jgi:hypothetical protein
MKNHNHRTLRSVVSGFTAILMLAMMLIAVVPPERAAAASTVYYVDSAAGSDSNSGTSTSAPWKSLSKVNAKTNYQPGDQILFKSGGVWSGSLTLKNSGASGNPITVGKYGEGPKPIINANAAYAAINLENIQYITLQDLELTNFNPANPDDYLTGYYRRNAIWIKAFHNGVKKDITIRNMDIHDVTGMSVNSDSGVNTSDGKDKNVGKNNNAAILINAWEWDTTKPKAYYDNLLIENNRIQDVSTIGIYVDGFATDKNQYHKNTWIRGNTIVNTGADAIVVGVASNPVIENNVSLDAGANGWGYRWIAGMWVWKTDKALVQFNEVGRVRYSGVKSETDSAAFDTDILASGDHIFQYNYSHDNEGGFYMDMGQLKEGKSYIRYNISQNDKRNNFHGNTINNNDPAVFHNNVFYNDSGIGFQMKSNPKAMYINNIFDVTGSPAESYASSPTFYYNAFHGQPVPAQGYGSITGDPGFVDPGTGADGIGSTEGYKLKPDSPLIGAGMAVINPGARDFWNNPIYTGSPDIGAYEDPTSVIHDTIPPEKPTSLLVTGRSDSTVTLSWQASEGNVPLSADIYNAATNTLLGSVMVRSEFTVTSLTPGTEYSFYVVARDRSNNASVQSDVVGTQTYNAVTVDNTAASLTGNWGSFTGSSSYNNNFVKVSAITGTHSIRWTPNLPLSGYYSVYYYLPNGGSSRPTNAPYTVSGAGGTKTYLVDQRPASGGVWIPLGLHRFNQGASGYVQLDDNANGEVVADAVKFVYMDTFSPDGITSIRIAAGNRQIRIGESLKLAVYGKDENGNELDLTADGASIQYTIDHPEVVSVANGVITGIAEGQVSVRAEWTSGGKVLKTEAISLLVGPQFVVEGPVFTDSAGNILTAITTGTVKTSINVMNSTDFHKRVTLVVAHYSPAGLVNQTKSEAVVGKYSSATLNVSMVLPEQTEGHYLKVFVWDSTVYMRPLAATSLLQ